MAIEAKLNLNPDPDSAVRKDLPSRIATTTILFSLSLLLHVLATFIAVLGKG